MESSDWHDGVSFVTDANDPSQTIIKVYADGTYFEVSPLVASIALPRRLANALAALIDVMPDEVAGCLRGECSADSRSRDQDTLMFMPTQAAGTENLCLFVSSCSTWPLLGKAGGHDHETTVDHALIRGLVTRTGDTSRSFLGLVTSVG